MGGVAKAVRKGSYCCLHVHPASLWQPASLQQATQTVVSWRTPPPPPLQLHLITETTWNASNLEGSEKPQTGSGNDLAAESSVEGSGET